MDKLSVITFFIHNIVVLNIPLLYGTVGEILVEKSGSLNLGVEGTMAVGAIFGYHPFYVSTVIKEKRGVTLHQYVVAYRMRLAKNMLECTDKTVAEIAEETGFTDASYFTKSFKAAFGKTPKEWRGEIKEDLI